MLYTYISFVVDLVVYLTKSIFLLEENAIYLSALEKDHIFPLKNVCFKKSFFEFDFYIFFSFK